MSGSCDPVFVDVETFCCVRRCQVELSLRTSGKTVGRVVSGVPVSCSLSRGCDMDARCLLKAERITSFGGYGLKRQTVLSGGKKR